ncbi:HEAT repeat domain-containing protein [Candidatus Solincola sp.]|nr:HEAT repeat domain-containing protein [Actinomycetota bacterium]
MEETGGKRSQEQTALDILTRLAIACKSRLLYSPDHPAVKDAVTVLHAVTEDSLRIHPEIAVRVEKDRFTCNGIPLGEERESLRRLASRIRALNIRALVFASGVNLKEVEALVELAVSSPEDIEKQGGAEAFLLGRGMHGIRVVESEAGKADEEADLRDGGQEAQAQVEEEVETAAAEDELERLLDLLFDPERLALALAHLRDPDGKPLEGEALAAAMYDFLKNAWEIVQRRAPERIPALPRSFAEALLFLENDLRNPLLLRHILPGMREGPPGKEILGRLNPQEASGVFSHLLPLAPQLIPKMDELFTVIGFRDRDLEEALTLLRERLIDLGEVPLPLLSALDAILASRGIRPPATSLPTADEISSLSEYYGESELEEIRDIAEMDIELETYLSSTPMLLDLLQRGEELDNLGKVVNLLVENFWGLVTSARFSLAASILEAFERALHSGNPALLAHREQLEGLLEEASRKGILQRIIQMASERRGDRETVEGFKAFMRRLGDGGLLAMIDALGSEENMSVRKFIIDTLADLARDRVSLLGSFLDDPRWYLVRNIVTVMAGIRSPFTLPYLERAMAHPHPRVRSEAVRAIGLTGGYEAESLLIKGLAHPDKKVRVFCIRWLGRLEVTRAVPRLEAMLEEREPGAEESTVKKEILESLGKIGDPSTYELLRKYAGRQRGLFRSEWQELATTAREALQQLVDKYPHLARKW